ncbi:general transcription factor 3C polypeptide 2 [Clinocottus analis]|uniref:general transcription factor 3C polypeptide 2 n=1 Tax=Clinocottus analis TaxID=304258 RepID=UPI0035C00855
MDPIDSGQGQEKPSALTPSSRGRQRRANTKYSDYETDDSSVKGSPQKPQRTRSGGAKGAAAKKTPTRRGKAANGTQRAEDEEREAAAKTPLEGETPERATRARRTPAKKKTPAKKTPAKRTPAKKTPAKKTPAKRTPAPKTPAATGGQGVVADTPQLENGTPKPKRRYVRKQPPEEEPAAEPPSPTEPEEETTPSGRHRRGAAKAALKYLHILAKEVLNHPAEELDGDGDVTRRGLKGSRGRTGRKRKRRDSNASGDEDFVPNVNEEEVEEQEDEEEEEAEDSDSDSGAERVATYRVSKSLGPSPITPNGLTSNVMKTVWEATNTAKKFREEHHSSWVFPEWVVSSKVWHLVAPSDLERYLPQELQSAAIQVSREGLGKEETPLQRLGRFTAVPAHPDRWDMLLFAGGPVWALEWCPTPDGAPACQYVALACHGGMEDRHCVNKTHSGAGLVQLWDLGPLQYNSRPPSQPALAYGLAQDKGFVWHVKWCPAGGWELPSCGRTDPFLPRLGLLAVATSTGVVTIYSLPHPDALHSSKGQTGKDITQLPIYQAEGVVTLKLGALKAPRHDKSGQVLCMDWLPEKPHNIMAIGFYDGVVGLWDLSTKSALLRLQDSGSLNLLPYRCLLAHDHAVRALAFCPASRFLLATAGEDRLVKTWDLRRLQDPITVQKRYLTNELYWPLNGPGLLMAQETAYTPFGSQGVHYFDHHMRAIFAVPRTGTVWSISYSEWLNSLVTADTHGDVIICLLPQIGIIPQYIKRTLERRFPVYLTSLLPRDDATEEDEQETAGVQEEEEVKEKDVVEEEEEQEGGETEALDAEAEGENESEGGGGDGGRKDECPPLLFQTYKEAVKKNWIQQMDSDLRTFGRREKRSLWKRMRDTELKTKLKMDEMPLSALHKVRFNPNMCCHTWLASGGQSGLVRVNCLRGMITPQAKKTVSASQAQFTALYSPEEQEEL